VSVAQHPEAVALPASAGQQRLWFLEQVQPGTGRYNMGLALRIPHAVQVDALRGAMDALAARHESLRTVFTAVGAEAAQVIHPPAPVDLLIHDLSTVADEERSEACRRLLDTLAQRPYDLARGPLFRPELVRLGPAEHVLALNLHHAVADEASLAILAAEARTLYAAFAAGLPDPLGEPPVQYADFAIWQREMLDAGEMDRQLAWWAGEMRGVSGILDLPVDRSRPPVQGWRGASHSFAFPDGVRDGLWTLARGEGATPFMAALALFQLLLGRLAEAEDVVIGTPASGRTPETEGTVGFFVNTLAMRANLAGDPDFRTVLRRVRDAAQGAFAHPDLPLERLVEALPLERDASRPPLFQAMFVFGVDSDAAANGWEAMDVALESARYELTLVVRDNGQGLAGQLDYAADLFDAETAARICGQLCTLAAALATDPGRAVWDAPLLSDAEAERIRAWSAGPPQRAWKGPVHRAITACAASMPAANAIITPAVSVSYGALERRADGLARRLIALGVRAEERVAIIADRSPDAIIALLSVLKAGAAYVPIDPANPVERAAAIVADAGIRFALCRAEDAALAEAWGVQAVAEGEENAAELPIDIGPDRLAYVIYTSGSTGTPKGVMVSHGGLANLAIAFAELHGFAPGERVLVIPPLSFDASVGDVFPALLSGAALVLHPSPGELGGEQLLRFCHEHAVTMVDTAAALWGQWTDEIASKGTVDAGPLRMVMMGGEAAALDRAAAWARATGGAIELVNHYGPTETTVCSTLLRTVDGSAWRGRSASLPIGAPVEGTRVHVLDRRGHPAPIGVPGELWIGGAGVARGYLGQPALTADRFVPDRFATEPGARMYRTGDRVRILPDGAIEFLGRADHQVKVRGYRIEPGEVEAALLAHPSVREALVMAREDVPGRRRLVAYLSAPSAPETLASGELRAWLRGRLPDYMVPSAFVILPALPVTPHGKVDRQALPAPSATQATASAAARTETERALADIWAQVLDEPAVGVEDDFFELGGHSLLALALVNRVRGAFGVEVPLRTLFAAPTVAAMAAAVDVIRAGGTAETSILPPEMEGDLRLADNLHPSAPYRPDGPPRAVFLTGATGFLGAYLLHGLLRRTEADVYCLVRASSADQGRARISANVATYLDWDAAWDARIIPVVGDLAEPGFGLDETRFRALAERTDSIVHNGGVVNFTLSYGRMRAANVLGTAEVLRLASTGRAHPVHFVSTLGIYLSPDTQDARIGEDTPPPDVARLHDAYSQTKWVADALVRRAAENGVPITIHRPARVGPDSRTGATNPDDWFSRVLRSLARMGAAPELPWRLDLAPVDQVAAAVVHAVADPEWLGGIFHYFNPLLLPFPELADAVRETGIAVETLPYPAWRERAQAAASDPTHPLHPLLPLFGAELAATLSPRFHAPRTEALMAAAGAGWTLPDRALLRRTLQHFIRRGVLDGAPPAAAPQP
jgi:myxalamid-type nonribosomal peptide synthetase MxaA